MVEPALKGDHSALQQVDKTAHSSRDNTAVTSTSTSNILAKSSPAGVSKKGCLGIFISFILQIIRCNV